LYYEVSGHRGICDPQYFCTVGHKEYVTQL
jgi:hypothetical protein